jgi:hypothetical protein
VGFRIDSWVLFYEGRCLHSVVAGRGIISSTIATGVLGFITTILFLFCIPDLDTFFALDAPQPFVQVYALALGKGPSIFMTIIAVLGLMMVRILSWAHRDPKTHWLSRSTTEHHHRRCGILPADLRRRARRRAPALGLDRARHFRWAAEERGHCDVCVRRGFTVYYPPERGRVHLAGLCRGSTDHRGVRPHCAAAPHADAARIQVVAFLPRALGAADVRLDGAVQRARFCCASFFPHRTARPR